MEATNKIIKKNQGNKTDANQMTLNSYEKSQKYVITNLVAHTNLGVELNLSRACAEIKEIEFEPDQFQHAILKVRKPKLTFLIFGNGTIICQGAKDLRIIKKIFERLRIFLLPYSESTPILDELPFCAIPNPVPQISFSYEPFPQSLPNATFSSSSVFHKGFQNVLPQSQILDLNCLPITTKNELPIIVDNIVVKLNLMKKVNLLSLGNFENVEYDPERFISGATLKFNNSKASVRVYTNGKIICLGAKNLDEISSLMQKTQILIKKSWNQNI